METEIMEPQFLPEMIEGERIVLKRLVMGQAEEHNRVINDNKEHLKRYMVWADKHATVADTKKYIAMQIHSWENQECFDYTIWEKETNQILGGAGTVVLKWKDKACEIGYWLSKDAEGNGYMSEAVRLLEDELFKAGMNRVQIGARESNKRSQAVPKRNGYTYEGTIRNNVIENGEVRSSVIHSKLREEWEAEQKA